MTLDWKNQYSENEYTTPKQSIDSMQSLLSYQWYFSQNWNKKKGLTIHMETQKAMNSQSNVEKEEWNWRIQPF